MYVITHPESSLNKDLIIKLRNSLNTIRDGDKNFCILYIPREQIFENVIVREMNDLWYTTVHINLNIFSKIMNEFKFSSDIWD